MKLTDKEIEALKYAAGGSPQDWRNAVDAIKAVRGGVYPPDWFERGLSLLPEHRRDIIAVELDKSVKDVFAIRHWRKS